MVERARPKRPLPAKPEPEFIPTDDPAIREDWAQRINSNWRKAVRSIIQTGRDLIAAKRLLDPADFKAMLEGDLEFDRTTGSRLMTIADDDRICAHAHKLPPSWMTLYELTKLADDDFAKAVANGAVHPGMQRKDVQKLLPGPVKKRNADEPAPKVAPKVADDAPGTSPVSEPEDDDVVGNHYAYHTDPEALADGVPNRASTFREKVARRVLYSNLSHTGLKKINALIDELVGAGPVVEHASLNRGDGIDAAQDQSSR